MDYIDYCAVESVFMLNRSYYDFPRDEELISISNAIILTLDSFHTEVTRDEVNYALWYKKQQHKCCTGNADWTAIYFSIVFPVNRWKNVNVYAS